jgi:hypothetical protein
MQAAAAGRAVRARRNQPITRYLQTALAMPLVEKFVSQP